MDSPTDFTVDTRSIPRQGQGDEGRVTCTITNPSGAKTEKVVVPMVDGTYKVSYTPFEEGRHTIDIFYDNIAIPGSPFIVNVRRGCDAKRCRAFGPGLEQGFVNKENFFTVETKGKLFLSSYMFLLIFFKIYIYILGFFIFILNIYSMYFRLRYYTQFFKILACKRKNFYSSFY